MNKKYLIMIGTALLIFGGMCAVITGCGEEQLPESTPGSSDTLNVSLGAGERGEVAETTGQTEQAQPSEQTETTREEQTQVQTQSKDETTATTEATTPQKDTLTFEEYLQMSSKEQRAYFDSYEDPMQFIAWFDAAQADYIRDNPAIEVTGPIDFSDLIGKQP